MSVGRWVPPLESGVWLGLKKHGVRIDAEEVGRVYPERAVGRSGMRKSSYPHGQEISAQLRLWNSFDFSTCHSISLLHVKAEGLKTNVRMTLNSDDGIIVNQAPVNARQREIKTDLFIFLMYCACSSEIKTRDVFKHPSQTHSITRLPCIYIRPIPWIEFSPIFIMLIAQISMWGLQVLKHCFNF